MDNLALRHLNVKTISYIDVAGKGGEADLFRSGRSGDRHALFCRRCRYHLAVAPEAQPPNRVAARLQHVYRDIELPAMHVLYTMEPQRRVARQQSGCRFKVTNWA